MIAWFVRHPNAANLLMVALILIGLLSLGGLRRETFPQIANDEVQVRVVYRGATPQEVEDAVCRRIEDALEGVVGLIEIRCEAREGLGVATAVMQEGLEMMRFLDDVQSEVDAIDDFPDETEAPVVQELGRTKPVVAIAVTGPEDPVALKAYAEELKGRLLAKGGIAEVNIEGFADHQLRVEIPAWRLRQYGLSMADVARTIQRQSVGTPAGRLEGGSEEILVRVDDQGTSVQALEDLVVISSSTGAALRLGEIATVRDGFEEDEEKVIFDGRRAAILSIARTQGQDVLDAYHRAAEFVTAEQALAPAGITLTLTRDLASIVQDRLDMLLRNGAQGFPLVFLILWAFFGMRYGFWVSMGLPVSFLGGLFVLAQLGISINMISMVGLLIGIGLLMDDAIVIAENIAARMEAGRGRVAAAIEGTRQVLPGVVSSFVTTLLVFGSLAVISGDLGQILRVMPIVLLVVLSVSLVEAFLILPNHLAHAGAHRQSPPRWRVRVETGLVVLRERYFGPLLDRAVDYRYLALGLVILVVLATVALRAGGVLKFQAFPELDGDVAEARVLLPQGTPLARTEVVVAEIEAALMRVDEQFRPRQPNGQALVQHVSVIYGENPDAHEEGAHVARVVADLLGAEVRDAPLDEFFTAWRRETGMLPDVIWLSFTEPALGPAGKAIDLRLLGRDPERLKAAGEALKDWLNGFPGVHDLIDDLRPGKREYRLHMKPSAGALGVDAQLVADQLRSAFQGITVDEFPVGTETYEVDLRLRGADRLATADLMDFAVVGPNGAAIPLPLVAEIESYRGWARILRIDGQRSVTLQGDVDTSRANAEELIGLVQREFMPRLNERFPEIRLQVEGQTAEAAKTLQSLVRNVIVGLVGVYLMLALQLRSYALPIVVMGVIPTALIGVFWGHLAFGLDLTMPSMVGAAALFGVVVNDSILLAFFIREGHGAGSDVPTAAKKAGRARFRPILLTSITTIAGLTPLLLEKSLQAQVLIPLAVSLAFGLTSATIVALILVPILYCILNDLGWAEERKPLADDEPRDREERAAQGRRTNRAVP